MPELAFGLYQVAMKMCFIWLYDYMIRFAFSEELRKTSLVAMWRMEKIRIFSLVAVIIIIQTVRADLGQWPWKVKKAKELEGYFWSRSIEFSNWLNVRHEEEEIVSNAWNSSWFLTMISLWWQQALTQSDLQSLSWPHLILLLPFLTPSSCSDLPLGI